MKNLVEYLDSCGNTKNYQEAVYLKVSNISDIYCKIIPFFEKYPILANKAKDFHNYCKVAKLIHDKSHTTEEGFNLIEKIQAGMNQKRIFIAADLD